MSDIPERDEAIIMKELFGSRPAPRARFYLHGAKQEEASQTNGYPVFEDRVYVEIRIPDSTDFMSHPATPGDIRQHPEAYKLFERARDWKQHPLELLPSVTPAILATLKSLGLHTIEQLAAHTSENAPWLKADDGDPFPILKGELPASLHETQATAKRFMSFNKPRMRLVDGKIVEAA